MTNRTIKIASVMLMGVAIGSFVIAAPPLRAAEDCLSKPKGAAPAGSHWYYRVDRATKRNCWYVAAEGRSIHSGKSSAKPTLRQVQTPLQPSVANARAEAAPADFSQTQPETAASSAYDAPAANSESNLQAMDVGQGAVASRWLDQPSPDAAKTTAPQSATYNESLKPPMPSAALAPATPRAAAVPLATADAQAASAFSSIPKLFLVMLGTLAGVAIFGAFVFRFGRKSRDAGFAAHREKRAPWEAIDVGATMDAPPPSVTRAESPRFAREVDKPTIPNEIAQLLSRLSKEAAA